jgi:CheY-like chemotaxis protein
MRLGERVSRPRSTAARSEADRTRRVEADVPFIMVSGDLGVTQWTRDNPRVLDVLTKPFRPELLLEAVRQHLTTA